MDNWIKTFRNAETIHPNDTVLIPGDPEREMTFERLKNGVPIQDAVVEDLKQLADKFSLTFNPMQNV